MKIQHHNPGTLHSNPAFSQAVSVERPARTIYVGGQNGIDADGKMAGDDLATQTERALENVIEALKAADASQEHVAKLTIYVVDGQDINQAFAAAQKTWGRHPTAISVVVVAGLVVPHALVEIEAIAAT